MTSSGDVDLSRLRIDRDAAPRRPWMAWTVAVVVLAGAALAAPRVWNTLAERRAPEVEVAQVTRLATTGPASADLPVLVATGYVIARRSSDVGVKVGGRLGTLKIEEGTRVRRGDVLATIEHADLDAQLAAARRAVDESQAQLGQYTAALEEDRRNLERQRALMRDGITTQASLTSAEAALGVSEARVKSAQAAIASAQARVTVTEEAIENTNVRAPFDGVVIKKRAEVGETVSPFGVQGQSSREGGAIATIADLRELEVQTEVSESNVAKLRRAMPAEIRLQAYENAAFRGRLREIFPSADRAKAIVEVRVSLLDPDERVKPEMTATVTFQEPRDATATAGTMPTPDVMVMPKRAVTERGGQPAVWVVAGGKAQARAVTLGAERLENVEVRAGVMPGEAVIVNPPADLVNGAPVRTKGSAQ